MEEQELWHRLQANLLHFNEIRAIQMKDIAGFVFLYIDTKGSKKEIKELLEATGASIVKGKKCSFEMEFVRSEGSTIVFRARFLLPNVKMFCCGNGCSDCFLNRNV